MLKIIFPLLALIGGMALATQGQINGGLGKKVGVFEGSFISFSVGTLALLFILLFLEPVIYQPSQPFQSGN